MKKSKKGICILLSMVLMLSVISVTAYAAHSSDFVVKNSVLTAYNGTGTIVNIPSNLGITKISDSLFANNKTITSVTIPKGVTSIGTYVFSDCSALTSVTIPSSVTSIPQGMFSACSALTSVTIPTGVTTIGPFAFTGCSSLTSIQIPDLVTSIGASVFNGCSSLTSVTIPDNLSAIGEAAFYGCSSLTSIELPRGLTSVGFGTFGSCAKLTSITIPDSVTSIGDSAFAGCSGLTAITIPKAVTEIGGFAFSDCTGLTSVNIPENVTSVGEAAFFGCSGLTSITIPSSVTSLGVSVFGNFTGNLTITGAAGSYIQGYAQKYNITFVVSSTTQAAVITAEPVNVMVQLNGNTVSVPAYIIGEFNYYRLRDIAALLNGTAKQFEVSWDSTDNSVKMTSGKTYTKTGSEFSTSESAAVIYATPSGSTIYLDGLDGVKKLNLMLYTIDGYNCVQLNDIASNLNFGVTWDSATRTICIDPATANNSKQ